jgi:DNA-binding MarR family transcriptional regulator
MQNDNMSRVAMDLLSIPPLIFRLVRRKLVTDTLVESDPSFKLLHFEILKVLHDEGTMHVAKIGDKLIIAKAQMTHLIDKLVELGFIERVTSPNDRRSVNISITKKGDEFIDEHNALILNAVRENMASLPDNELESLSGSLRLLRDTLFKME